MELLNSTQTDFFVSSNSPINDFIPETVKPVVAHTTNYTIEQEKYYKESIIINYQRYRALFRSNLVAHILVDDKNIVRDINKKAKDDLLAILGVEVKIGTSLSGLKGYPCLPVFQKILQNTLNEQLTFELTDSEGKVHAFEAEVVLFISPVENALLKCISTVKVG